MKKIISIVLIAIVILALVITFIYFKNRNTSKNTTVNEPYIKTAILKEGTGEEAINGRRVTVNYTGWLTNGTKFDSSLDRNQPLEFTLGNHEVIEGWEKGVLGMKVGEIRRLEIPPEMAYGDQDLGIIPPNSRLIFEVELIKVSK